MILSRPRLLLAGYGMFAVILFLAFVTASFPYAETISTLLAPIRIKVVFQRQTMSFPIGARLQNVQLISLSDERLLLHSPDVTVSPSPTSFLGRPRLRIGAELYGGLVDASIHQDAQAVIADFELKSLNLAHISRQVGDSAAPAQADTSGEHAAPGRFGTILSGELSGSGSAQVTGPGIFGTSASLVLFGSDVKALVVNGLPALELGIVRGEVSLGQGVATLKDIRAQGADGDLEASGEIHLEPDFANSTLQLTLSLSPSSKGRTTFGMLLNLLPHSPSMGPYHLEGPVKFPLVS
jgi:type II secretion system protein N